MRDVIRPSFCRYSAPHLQLCAGCVRRGNSHDSCAGNCRLSHRSGRLQSRRSSFHDALEWCQLPDAARRAFLHARWPDIQLARHHGNSGKLTNLGPEPAAYALNYVDGGEESAQLHASFNGGAVTQVLMLPKRKPTPRAIPIKKEQLAGVLDPLTALFLRAHSDNPDGDFKVLGH